MGKKSLRKDEEYNINFTNDVNRSCFKLLHFLFPFDVFARCLASYKKAIFTHHTGFGRPTEPKSPLCVFIHQKRST